MRDEVVDFRPMSFSFLRRKKISGTDTWIALKQNSLWANNFLRK